MSAAAAVIRARQLTRRFGDFVAVDGATFDVGAGEVWGFLGPNGSGKSTTIRMLCGVLLPSSGHAEVMGYDVAVDPESVKLRIGYMSQGSSLWNDLTVEEHLRFYAGMFGLYAAAQDRAVDEWTARLDLGARRGDLAGALAGGLRKRLALACTLLHRPNVLFLDEPTAGVDPLSRREFWDIIVELAEQGTSVVVSTHYLDEAEHCDRLALVYRGRIVAKGTPAELKHAAGVGLTLRIETAKPVAMLDAVDALPFVRSAALYGSSLHVTIPDARSLAALRQALSQAGFDEEPVPIVPSLEDVFAATVNAA